MAMDKRMAVSRSPRKVKKPISSASDRSGNPAVDGYTIRHDGNMNTHQPFSRHDSDNLSKGLKSVDDAMWDDYYEDQ